MKLLLCPKGYIGTRVDELDIMIEKLPDEERGYTLVDDRIASVLLKRGGYEEIPGSKYPRSLEQLRSKVRRQLLSPGILTGQPTVSVETLPGSIRQDAIRGVRETEKAHQVVEPAVSRKTTWLSRLIAVFRKRK